MDGISALFGSGFRVLALGLRGAFGAHVANFGVRVLKFSALQAESTCVQNTVRLAKGAVCGGIKIMICPLGP